MIIFRETIYKMLGWLWDFFIKNYQNINTFAKEKPLLFAIIFGILGIFMVGLPIAFYKPLKRYFKKL
jgi:hypothetical protein